MREELEKLAALQVIDLHIQEMERERRQIPRSITALEEELRAEEEKFSSLKTEQENLQKERRRKEKELEGEVDKVKKAEAKVFEIKTNKEYQAVLKEIETAKKLNRQREEEILEILEKAEELQRRLGGREQEMEKKREDLQRRMTELREKEVAFERIMAGEVHQREQTEKEIPPGLLTKYRMVAGKRQGVAVARVTQGVCLACHMNLRPQLYIELQRQESLILCPNCNRILFWENGSPKAGKS